MSNPSSNLEALLQNACRRALSPGLSVTDQLRLYRSILAMAREVRLRFGTADQTLANHLAQVCERAAACGLDPELPLPDAIAMQRLTVRLSCAARQAGGTETAQPRLSDPRAVQHEAPPEPAQEGPAANHVTRDPMQSETEAPDDRRLSIWRNDRPTERDQRADERLTAKVRETNRRDRGDRTPPGWARAA